jgi:TonB-dependent SusC/RagA subfamily outer membrane receptor
MKVSIRGGGTPLLLLDGMPTDLDMINSINPVEVETIEVLKGTSAAIYGIQGGNGVIAVYLKRGYSGNSRDRRGIISAKIPGYYTARQFYAPKYNIRKEEHDLPDRRSTLYWNPMVKTDAAGKAMVSFYNADEVTSMRAIVSGVSDSGLLGSTTFLIGQDN